ncbi:MAG: hypothetical protein WBD46_11600 [Acidobacteriaceae bacterium]
MRSVVLVRGSVEGMGCTARCEMLAMKEYLSETAPPIYSRCCVIDAPMELPDGDYRVTFAGHQVSAHKESGLWLPADDAVPLRSESRTARNGRTQPHTRAAFPAMLRKHSA